MKRKIAAGLALAGLLGISTAYAAGMFPDYPIVGGASYCAGTSNTAVGSIIGSVTGCPNTVPAGPTIVTGSEQIPADTRLSGGASPQTVLIPMASLNALPLTFVTVTSASPSGISATNLVGGVVYNATAAVTAANITLPLSPIDGQQYLVASNFSVTALSVTAAAGDTMSVAAPTGLTVSVVAPQGYKWVYNLATRKWFRLQ